MRRRRERKKKRIEEENEYVICPSWNNKRITRLTAMDGEIEDKGIQERKKIYLFLCLTISRISVVLLCCGERCKSVFLSFSLDFFLLVRNKNTCEWFFSLSFSARVWNLENDYHPSDQYFLTCCFCVCFMMEWSEQIRRRTSI